MTQDSNGADANQKSNFNPGAFEFKPSAIPATKPEPQFYQQPTPTPKSKFSLDFQEFTPGAIAQKPITPETKKKPAPRGLFDNDKDLPSFSDGIRQSGAKSKRQRKVGQ